jgi:hypothetical protein
MARSRNIKPSIMDNDALAALAPLTRLLFVYLWMLADREGRLEDRPARIAAQALPYDRDADINAMLDELRGAGFINRYLAAGRAVIQIANFLKHQSPHGTERDGDLPDSRGLITIHTRGRNGYATGEKQEAQAVPLVGQQAGDCALTVNPPSENTLIPDSLIPDSYIAKAMPPDGAPADAAMPSAMTAKEVVWSLGVSLLGKNSRSFLGKLVNAHGEAVVAAVLADCEREKPGEPRSWVSAACANRQQGHKSGSGEAIDMLADPCPAWAQFAGFGSRFEAENAGCTERNHRQFTDGRKVAA